MPNSKAKFYYRSYIDMDVTGYSLSGDYTTPANAVDRNKLTFTSTDGYSTDGDSVDFVADMDYDRSIDTLVLKSNLKTFTIYIWDENVTGTGGEDYVELETYSSNDSEFLVIELDETIQTSKIKITATHTITENEEKKIYLFEITKKIDEMYLEDISIEKKWAKAKFENIYGGSVQVIKYPNHGKVEIELDFKNLNDNEGDFTAYKAIKDQMLIDSINVYLYFSDTYDLLGKEAYYLVNDLEDYLSDPAGSSMTEGINGSMKLLEC